MRAPIVIKRGNTRPEIRMKLNVEADLDAAGVRVVFSMSRNGALAVDQGEGRIENGWAVYRFTADDTIKAGVYLGEFTVIDTDGGTQTDPGSGYLQITIEQELSLVVGDAPDPVSPTLTGGSIIQQGADLVITPPTATGSPAPTVTRTVTQNGDAITFTGNRITNATPGNYAVAWLATNGTVPDATIERTISVAEPEPQPVAPTLTGGGLSLDGADIVITEPVADGLPDPAVSRVVTLDGEAIIVTGERIGNAEPGSYAATWTATNGTAPDASVTRTLSVEEPLPEPVAPIFTVQPSIGPGTATEGATFTLSEGTAPGGVIELEYLTLDGVDVRDDLDGLSYLSTGSGTLAARFRATLPADETLFTLSNEVTAVIEEATVEPEPGVALNMVQLPTPYQVTQRRARTGGGRGMGQGTLTVGVAPASATPIFARTRDVDTGQVMQAPWQVAANQPAGTATLTLSNVDVTPNWIFLDLAPSATGPWSEGTTPRAIGAITASGGQSQSAMFVTGEWGGDQPMSSVGVTPPARAACKFDNADGITGSGWARMVDARRTGANNTSYYGAGAAAFLAAEVERLGCVCAIVGAGHGGKEFSYFSDPTREGYKKMVQMVDGGFEQLLWHQGGEDANLGTTQATAASQMGAIFDYMLALKAPFSGTPQIVATAMATRTKNTVAEVMPVRRGMKQAVEAKGGLYIEPRDIQLNDDIHQTQLGNVTLAGHYARAFAGTHTPPAVVGGERSAAVIRIDCGKPIVVTGNVMGRIAVFPKGAETGRLPLASVAADGDDLVITLANDPGGTTELDVWLYYHPDERAANTYGIHGTDGQQLVPTLAGPIAIAGGAAVKPTTTGKPTMAGSFVAGGPVTFTAPAFSDQPTSFRWLIEQSEPSGTTTFTTVQATDAAYSPPASSKNRWLRATVWASNGAGESDPAVSENYGPVRAVPDALADPFDSGLTVGTQITGRTLPTGQTWAKIASMDGFSPVDPLSVGRVRAGAPAVSLVGALPANQYVEGDLFCRTRVTTAAVGVALRAQADGAHYFWRLYYTNSNYRWRLAYRNAAGTSTDLGTDYVWPSAEWPGPNTPFDVRAESEGTTHRLFINGTLRHTVEDGTITAGGGVGMYSNVGDNTTRYQIDAIRAGAL